MKGGLSILLMSVTFHMMISIKHTCALGDYILEFIGLKSWTGDYNYSGIHLTVIYFGILFIIGLFLVEKYAIDGLNIRRRTVFLIFVILITVFYSITPMTLMNIKKHSSGLLTIGYNPSNSRISYEYEDNKLVEFTAKFTLTNYSNEKKTFDLSIDSPFNREKGKERFNFYTFDEKPAIFQLQSNETKLFLINLDKYNVVSGSNPQIIGGSGFIKELILTSDKGNIVRLDNHNFFGVELNR